MKEAIVKRMACNEWLVEGTISEINNWLASLPKGRYPLLIEFIEKGGDGLNTIIAIRLYLMGGEKNETK